MTIGALALIWVIAALDAARGQVEARPPCQEACPAHLACMHYVTHIRDGRFLASLEQIMHLCPLPASIGRVCHHPCEKDCRRGREGEPIGICALKRFVADGHHGEARDFYRTAAPAQPIFSERIAVVGGGPSGLSAALALRIMGFSVTLIEAEAEAGGMPGTAIRTTGCRRISTGAKLRRCSQRASRRVSVVGSAAIFSWPIWPPRGLPGPTSRSAASAP